MFLAALRTYGAYLVDGAGGFIFYAEDTSTADLHLTDDQVNLLIGESPGTPLPAGRTKWQIVIDALDDEIVSIPFAYGPWPNGQDPATAQITTANFEVVDPATQPSGNTPTPTATGQPPTATPTPTSTPTVVATSPAASPSPSATVTYLIRLPMILKAYHAVSSGWWKPAVGTTWQWQLEDPPLDRSFDVGMYDIDLFDNEASTVATLHAEGRKVVCYISVGSWEDWRPDAAQFPSAVIGKNYEGWPGEKWLDIRQIDQLAPIMRARLDQCQAKGFDGIEPDNIDGYTNDTGFPLTYQDQQNYNLWLANEAHTRGLSIGLKNDGDQVGDLLPTFDWALTEDCFADDWCADVQPFVTAGKAVFAAEYTDTGITLDDFCAQAATMKFSAILKHRNLDAWRQTCP
ncbi:MAG: endo alpha-1,4 polygalactosaminidase [Chloroflexi bacterium]|nr:endo alpha-1,4 polygalactosaminidase [Chloroflexota bacterium]